MAEISFAALCDEVAKHLQVHPAYAAKLARGVVSVIACQAKLGHEVSLPGIGRLGKKRVGARRVRMPNGDEHDIEAHWYPRLRPAADLTRALRMLPVDGGR